MWEKREVTAEKWEKFLWVILENFTQLENLPLGHTFFYMNRKRRVSSTKWAATKKFRLGNFFFQALKVFKIWPYAATALRLEIEKFLGNYRGYMRTGGWPNFTKKFHLTHEKQTDKVVRSEFQKIDRVSKMPPAAHRRWRGDPRSIPWWSIYLGLPRRVGHGSGCWPPLANISWS